MVTEGLHRIRPPRMPAARNYGLNAGRTAGGLRLVRCRPTYTAKPYASWPGWCVNYGQNVRYSISSIIIILTLVLRAK